MKRSGPSEPGTPLAGESTDPRWHHIRRDRANSPGENVPPMYAFVVPSAITAREHSCRFSLPRFRATVVSSEVTATRFAESFP